MLLNLAFIWSFQEINMIKRLFIISPSSVLGLDNVIGVDNANIATITNIPPKILVIDINISMYSLLLLSTFITVMFSI